VDVMLFTCVLDTADLLQTRAGVNLEPVKGIQSAGGPGVFRALSEEGA